jgi:hypothetical protein
MFLRISLLLIAVQLASVLNDVAYDLTSVETEKVNEVVVHFDDIVYLLYDVE